MESSLRRRDHNNSSSDLGDEEDGDLDGDFLEFFLSGERGRSHESECCLISPYKRLRVEELTHTSVESQAGEGEAHSCLRSSDEADGYHGNYLRASIDESSIANNDLISGKEIPSQCETSQNCRLAYPEDSLPVIVKTSRHSDTETLSSSNVIRTIKGQSYSAIDGHENTQSISRISKTKSKDASFYFTSRASVITASHNSNPTFTFARSANNVTSINEVCMEKRCISFVSKDFITPLESEYTNTSSQPADLLCLKSHHVGLQSQSSCITGPGQLDFRPAKNSSQHNSHLFLANETAADPRIFQCQVGSIDFLEIHAGNTGTSGSECSNIDSQFWQISSFDKDALSCEDEDHYQTIDDVRMPAIVASSTHQEVLTTVSSISTSACTSNYDSNITTPEIMNNESSYIKAKSSKSVGISCTNISAPTKTTTATAVLCSHESAPCGHASNYSHGLRYSSHQELSSSVDSICTSRMNACTASSWNNVHHGHQEQNQPNRERLCSFGSSSKSRASVKSHVSSTQSYHVEELQVHLPQEDRYLHGSKHFVSSLRSSKEDTQCHSHEEFQNQQHIGTSRNSSAGSVDQQSCSSQTSTDKSYPSSLAMSEHKSKKAVLQSSGHLKISAYWNVGLLTIHVIQARCLSSSWKSHCCSYVKMSLVPDESRRTRCKTRIQVNTNNPVFDEKFSLEFLEEDQRKRLLISVWHKDPSNGASEFLGCMSFGVGHLLKRDVNGWYYLLTEEVGRKKHLQTHNKTRPVLTARNYQNVPEINRAVDGQERITITIARGKNGFGFSFVEEFPPKVGRVDRASPAECAGVRKGDLVIKINGQNVSRSTCDGVAHLIKKMNPSTLRLELLRDHHTVSTTTEITATGLQYPHNTSPYNKRGVGTSTDNLYESIEDRFCSDHHKENRAVPRVFESFEQCTTDDDFSYSQNSLPRNQGVTSTPRLLFGPRHKLVSVPAPSPLSKHEFIHRLMSLELNYIDFMHYGIERYSRPLRHSILSAQHHMTVFQNVEKLVTISEYHIKQMQENNSSINSDTDDSQSSESSMFPNSVALIYHSKIHMLSQAYEDYASGLSKSNKLLRELRKNQDFMNFIKESDITDEQCADHPSISSFINRPVFHIQDLYSVLYEIFSATPLHSPDFASLHQIVIKLSQCISTITGLSSASRVESLDSLASSKGKSSIASLSSTCSSSEADVHYPSSTASLRSIDRDVQLIQERLVFGPKVHAFQLLQEGRQLVYKGEIFRYSKGMWSKSQLILFSDMLLLVSEEPDGLLIVTNKPIRIKDLIGIEVHRKYASEFLLYHRETTAGNPSRRQQSSCPSSERIKTTTLRAPSSREKFIWKSLIELQVTTYSGSKLQHYGSMRDISHSKTSIIL